MSEMVDGFKQDSFDGVSMVWTFADARASTVKRTVPAAFTASETFDVGVDLGSPVALDYFDRRPFAFTGKISTVKVALK